MSLLHVTVAEALRSSPELLARVQAGDEVRIEEAGASVAILQPGRAHLTSVEERNALLGAELTAALTSRARPTSCLSRSAGR